MLKKSSIKNIFKKEKTEVTTTIPAWGELCTSKSISGKFSPKSPGSNGGSSKSSNGGGKSPGRKSGSFRGGLTPPRDTKRSNGSVSSHDNNKSSRGSESNERNRQSSSSSNSSRQISPRAPSNKPRFPLKNYVSASAVDLDDPIEAYNGPIDCDEVSLSSDDVDSIKDGVGKDSDGFKSANNSDDISEMKDATIPTQDNSSTSNKSMALTTSTNEEYRSSPDTIPVIYEDCYDSDYDHNKEYSSLVNNHHPLTAPYTNDETIDVPRDDDTLYSHEESISIMASMSVVEDGTTENGFGRMETDESALDDEDYYRQDYFMMGRSNNRGDVDVSCDTGEEEHTSLSERILMSKTDKHVSAMDATVMTEPDLPVLDREDEESQDYGDLYNDASFPIHDDEEDDGALIVTTTALLDNLSAGRSDDEGCNIDEDEDETRNDDAVSEPQERTDQSAMAERGILLPEDSEFTEESHAVVDDATLIDNVVTQIHQRAVSNPNSDEDIDIGNVIVENENHSVEEELNINDQGRMGSEESDGSGYEDVVRNHSGETRDDVVINGDSEFQDEPNFVDRKFETIEPIEPVCAAEVLKRDYDQSNGSLGVEKGAMDQAAESDETKNELLFEDKLDVNVAGERSIAEDYALPVDQLDSNTESSVLCADEDNVSVTNVHVENVDIRESAKECNEIELESAKTAVEINALYAVEDVLSDAATEKLTTANVVTSTCFVEQTKEEITPDEHSSLDQEDIMVARQVEQMGFPPQEANSPDGSPTLLKPLSSSPDLSPPDDGLSAEPAEVQDDYSIQQPMTSPTELANDTVVCEVTSLSIGGDKLASDSSSDAIMDKENKAREDCVLEDRASHSPINPVENTTPVSLDDIRSYESTTHSLREESGLIFSRSRSLSPEPPKECDNLRSTYEISRTASLPIKWNPFPASSPRQTNASQRERSVCLKGYPSCSDENTSEPSIESPETVASTQRSPPDIPASIDINKIIHENQRLRVKRQQLCESLGSMAQQFQAHENASSEKIFSLEQKIRALVAEKESYAVADKSSYYNVETVRRLSVGVIEQDARLETKDKQISQLKLRLEVMKRALHEKDENHHLAKRHWDDERSKLHACLTSSEKKSIFALQNELFESKAQLSNALSDIDALTAALESNNETLDATVKQIEELREFKSSHCKDYEEIQAPSISRTALPKLSSSSRTSDLSKKNIECGLDECNEFRELVVLSDGKTHNDLKAEVQLLRNEANAARLESKFANHRIELLSAELEAKTEKAAKLQQELTTRICRNSGKGSHGVDTSEISPREETTTENPRPPSPDSEYWSSNLKNFSIVADLEQKIIELEKKLNEYENPTPVKAEEEKSKLTLDPSKEQSEATDTPKSSTSPSKRVPPESPLTARRLFQPLRRGWATASPLIKNPLTDSNESDLSKEKDVNELNNTIKANTEVMEKLKQDIIKMQTEKEETEMEMMTKISKLTEENTGYAAQVEVLEQAFREMNEKRASDGNSMIDDEESVVATTTADPLSPSAHSETSDNTFGRELDLRTENATLQRSITELESTQSHQEDEIERLKSELVKARVTSQQENEQLQKEVAIVTAQRAALESQLIEINKSAGAIRDSLSDQVSTSPNKEAEASNKPASPRTEDDRSSGGNADPILVAQVVMLENANRVLEQNVNSLRSDLQQRLTPLLEKVAMLEEEKRIMEDEMKVKLECREMTIKNLEHSLQQLNASRFGSGKKKRHTAQLHSSD